MPNALYGPGSQEIFVSPWAALYIIFVTVLATVCLLAIVTHLLM